VLVNGHNLDSFCPFDSAGTVLDLQKNYHHVNKCLVIKLRKYVGQLESNCFTKIFFNVL